MTPPTADEPVAAAAPAEGGGPTPTGPAAKPSRSAWWLGLCGAVLIRGLGCTWRTRITGIEDMGREIYAILHGHLLLPIYKLRRQRPVVMISQHGDGEIIAQAVQRLGFSTVRGSSTRGGAAAAGEMMRGIHGYGGRPWVVTPDGPKGPRGSVKRGLIRMAAASGRPLRPVAGAAAPAKVFRSWDRFTLPLPLARVAVHFGEPLVVPADLDADGIQTHVERFEALLQATEKVASDALANW